MTGNNSTNRPMSKPETLRLRRHPHGFALIATISVMVLLVMIALAMLSLSTLEIRSSRQDSYQAEARGNARMALMLAIAELQKTTGPDQRITASADMAGKADGSALPDGDQPENNEAYDSVTDDFTAEKGLTAVHPGTRHWLGTWTPVNLTDPAPDEDPAHDIYTKTPTPFHHQWLISGMEAEPGLTPASITHQLSANGLPSDPEKTVVLVGKNTVGAANATTLKNYVSAPLVSISGSNALNQKTTGRYAWWIGDEGAKSRINLAVDYTQDTEATYPMLAASRRGWEVVDGFSAYPTPDENQDSLKKVITQSTLELLDTSFSASGPDASPIQRTFHAATPYSVGLLTNSLSGGLKVDLTRYLEDGFPTSSSSFPSNFVNPPLASNNMVPQLDDPDPSTPLAPNLKGVKWSQLKKFYDLGKSLGSAANPVLTVQPAPVSSDDLSISPIISEVKLLFGAWVQPATQPNPTNQYHIHPCVKVAFALSNPYPYPLKWDSALEIEILNGLPSTNPCGLWINGWGARFYYIKHHGAPSVFNKAIFSIAPDTLQPGEGRAYTIASKVTRPWVDHQTDQVEIIIPLTPLLESDPTNLSNSLVLLTEKEINVDSRCDVRIREAYNTTLADVEMKLSGNDSLLRSIKGFELDNTAGGVARTFDRQLAPKLTKPFPLLINSYQISQPGADYKSVLPADELMGIRFSAIRTFTDFNLQAVHIKKPITSYNPPPYFYYYSNNDSEFPFLPSGGDTGPIFTRNIIADPLPWGHSPFGSEKTILFSPPAQFISLAQFQHADLTADDQMVSVAHQPGNAVGNSYAPPFIKREMSIQERDDYTVKIMWSAAKYPRHYYDMSYLLNATLWDQYFLSTIPTTGDPIPLNQSIIEWPSSSNATELRDGLKAAEHLAVKGSFNVNSTSKDAWKALIASTQKLKHPADPGEALDGAMFPRSLEQPATSAEPPSGDSSDSWAGYRRLTPDEIDSLAEEIVKQVRLRGPFTSMAHFVNRALIPLEKDKAMSRCGALQAAIDNSGLTISPDGTQTAFTDIDPSEDEIRFVHSDEVYPEPDMRGWHRTRIVNDLPEPLWAKNSAGLNPGNTGAILADRPMLLDDEYKPEQGFRSTGIPGWLTQADVLQALGPSLTARSDTFRIRTYGESLDPATGKVRARAWCEAIVQRTPAYLDSANPPDTPIDDLNEVNQKYGRRYTVTSFRWLSSNDI